MYWTKSFFIFLLWRTSHCSLGCTLGPRSSCLNFSLLATPRSPFELWLSICMWKNNFCKEGIMSLEKQRPRASHKWINILCNISLHVGVNALMCSCWWRKIQPHLLLYSLDCFLSAVHFYTLVKCFYFVLSFLAFSQIFMKFQFLWKTQCMSCLSWSIASQHVVQHHES